MSAESHLSKMVGKVKIFVTIITTLSTAPYNQETVVPGFFLRREGVGLDTGKMSIVPKQSLESRLSLSMLQ